MSGKGATLHQSILSEIEGRIVSGEWPPGHRIPFEVDLAAQYGCSRMTVNKVMAQLVASGLIERRRKGGSFVSRPRGEAAILEIHDVESEVKALNLSYRHRVLSVQERGMRVEDEKRIELKEGEPIIEIRVLHYAGKQPFCLEDRLISVRTAPTASVADFARTAPGPWLLEQIPWTSAEHRIFATSASADVAQDLAMETRASCLVVERRTWLSERPVTSVRFVYRGDEHAFVARFSPAGSLPGHDS